jgi:hypothetical protein
MTPEASGVRPFPFHRRRRVLQDIADTFLRDGFEAGNKRARDWGWTLIVKYAEAGIDHDQACADLDKFIKAWRAFTIPLMAKQQRGGGAA